MQCVVSRKHVADRQLSKPVQKQQSTGFHLVRVAPSEIPSRQKGIYTIEGLGEQLGLVLVVCACVNKLAH